MQDKAALKAAIAKFTEERDYGKARGNYMLTTSAGFRLAVATYKPAKVYAYLLNEMGIKAEVKADANGLTIGFGRYSHHSHATVMRDLQGAFRVMSLMHEDGRQVIRVLGFSGFPISQPISIHA